MPLYEYMGSEARTYPIPPLARELSPGDVVDLNEDQVPDDGRFTPTPDPPPKPTKGTTVRTDGA